MKKIVSFVLFLVLMAYATVCRVESAVVDSSFTLGNVNGSCYTNEYLGLGCVLDGWHYYSSGELAKLNASELERLPDNLETFVREKQSFILMFAETIDKLQNASISVTYSKGAETELQQTGMHAVVMSLYPQLVNMQYSLGRKNPRVTIVSDVISGEEVYGSDVIYEFSGADIYQRGIMLAVKDYVLTITATGKSTEEVENTIHSFFFLNHESEGYPSGMNANEQINGEKQKYIGKIRPIAFEVPNEWEQQTLSQEYKSLEAKFVLKGSAGTMIQYACQDMISIQSLPESMRSFYSTGFFSEDDIKEYYQSLLSDMDVEKTKIGDLDCFVVRGTYGWIMTFVVFFEEGYLHQLSLFEMDNTMLDAHEKVLFDIARTVKVPD